MSKAILAHEKEMHITNERTRNNKKKGNEKKKKRIDIVIESNRNIALSHETASHWLYYDDDAAFALHFRCVCVCFRSVACFSFGGAG